MTKYFLIVASKDHVLKGVKGGFAQAGHGRKDLMSKPSKGDWLVYYSIGQVADEEPYQPNTHADFKPYRRDVTYKEAEEADIRPLLEELSFIKNKKRWGFYLIGGFREIPKDDFGVIKKAMK
jgi:hypothetical protein